MSSPISLNIAKSNDSKKYLEKDANGYYKICLGAINSFNSNKDFYLADGFESMISNPNDPLGMKLQNGNLMGEANHPAWTPGYTKEEFFNRVIKVDLANVSHHIKGVYTKPTNIPSGLPGKGNIIAVMGWVKPLGKLGETLRDSLENPDQNTCFSIRCFTNDEVVGGINFKKFSTIITWDWVVSPGISIANKFNTLGMESIYTETISLDMINNAGFTIKHKTAIGEDDKCALAHLDSIKRSINHSDIASEILLGW